MDCNDIKLPRESGEQANPVKGIFLIESEREGRQKGFGGKWEGSNVGELGSASRICFWSSPI
jgi:hypothetical protein